MATTVLMAHQGNLGYGAEQVQTGVTLADLLEQVQDAITEWGDDALVVMHQTNNGHGANFGSLHSGYGLFEDAAGHDDDEEEDL